MDNNGSFAVENWYIDFIDLQIGRKIGAINSLVPKHYAEPKQLNKALTEAKSTIIDDKFISQFILSGFHEELYVQDSIAKIIDYQFTKSQFYFKVIFWMYFLMFVCPFWVTLIINDHNFSRQMLKICLVPQTFVLF